MGKLVRDFIPNIIEKSGRKPIFHIAESLEYKNLLMNKLVEEVNELIEANISKSKEENMEEIADIFEVIEAICLLNSYNLKDILKIKKQKQYINGSFSKKIILE